MTVRSDDLAAFSRRLAARRAAILGDWETRVASDPRLLTGKSLPIAQLHDHLTALLEDFEQRLRSTGSVAIADAEDRQVGDASAHGLHRWQQGFDLAELVRELGRLNESVLAEIDRCALEPALADAALGAGVRAVWAAIHSVAITASTEQFFKLQQIEAMGHVSDLEQALDTLRTLEAQRAALWQEAAHDLRGNLGVVTIVAAGLSSPHGSPESRDKFVASLGRNVRALHAILQDVTSLARLQGGQEVRTVAALDVAAVMADVVGAMDGLAQERRLSLRPEGPSPFVVDGDATKIRRIVQNLTLNALRYTERGGVSILWGFEAERPLRRWFVTVRDTGPGLQAGPGSALAGAIGVASEQARHVAAGEASGDVVHASSEDSSPVMKPDGRGQVQKSGEGIGLSIVKRLCTLLDATIEVDSAADRGTAFRILFPVRYDA